MSEEKPSVEPPAKPSVETLDTSTRGHHPDSASSLQSSEACPAFSNEQRDSQASKAGVLQHKSVETRDLSILDGDEQQEWAVKKCIDYEDNLLGQFKLAGETPDVLREKYLAVGDEVVVDSAGRSWTGITGGSPDVLMVGRRRVVIPDWKFGREPVTPTKDNLQGSTYALGAFRDFPRAEEAEVHFFAPYQRWDAETQRLKYVYTFRRDEIPKLELRVRTVIARKHEAAEQVAAGNWEMARPKHDLCLWCSRKGVCPKVGALVIQANEKYSDLTVPDEVKEYRLTRPEQVAHAYRFANQLQTICEAIKKRCIDVSVTEDLKPEGFTIVRMAKRQTKSVKGFLEVAASHGIPEAEALELLTVPITSFEDLIKSKAVRGQGAARIRAFAAELAEHGVTEMGKPFYFLREIKSPAERQPIIEIAS